MDKKILLLALGVAASASVHAQTKKTSPNTGAKKTVIATRQMPADPDVKIGKLPNGLVYYIRKNQEPKNRAELYLANKVGSLLETDEQRGLAHFAEHMAFNGTADFPKNEIINYLQKAGVRFGPDLNAYTRFNETVYQLPIPTDSLALFKNGFKILANWAGKVSMNAEDIDAERGVIVEEDRQRGKNVQQRIAKQLFPVLLANSKYQHRWSIGDIELLKTFKYDKIRSFYSDWYRPNLQAVIAVGDFDVNEVEQLIKANFSAFKNPQNEKKAPSFDLPDNEKPLAVIATDKEQPYNVAMVMYKHKEAPAKTDAEARRTLMQQMINIILDARFKEILQKGDAPFLFAQSKYGSYQNRLVKGVNAFETVAVAKSAAELQSALKAAAAENERMVKFGFTQEELASAKKQLASQNELGHKESNKTKSVEYVQEYLDNFLNGMSMPSEDYRYQLIKASLASVGLAEINALAKTMVTEANQVLTVQAPEKEKANLPTAEQLLAALKTAGENVKPYVNDVVNKPLLSKMPVGGKIVEESKDEKIGVTTLVLSNGIKVLLKPTTFKNDQILFKSFAPGGLSVASQSNLVAANVNNFITSSGVGEFSASQLDKFMAGKNIHVDVNIESLYQGFSGFTTPSDLETALQLVYAYATAPRKDAAFYDKKIAEGKVVLAGRSQNPEAAFADTLQAVLTNYSQREIPLTPESLDQASLDKTFDFYQSLFANNSRQTFVLVGNFDIEKIKPLLATYIAGLPVTGKPLSWTDHHIAPQPGKVKKVVYKGLEDKVQARLIWHGDYVYSEKNNLDLLALKGALEIKMLERLREKESGVYSPKVDIALEKQPMGHYYVTIAFSCATQNLERLVAAAKQEVATFVERGASAEDLEKFKAEERRQQELNLRENSYWLGYLTQQSINNEDMAELYNREALRMSITPNSSKQAAQKYLNENNFIQVVLMPQQK